MTKVLVLYHSTYGHLEMMAEAVAAGAREVEGVQVDIRRVPELVPEELAIQSGYKMNQAAPVANVARFHTAMVAIWLIGFGTLYLGPVLT